MGILETEHECSFSRYGLEQGTTDFQDRRVRVSLTHSRNRDWKDACNMSHPNAIKGKWDLFFFLKLHFKHNLILHWSVFIFCAFSWQAATTERQQLNNKSSHKYIFGAVLIRQNEIIKYDWNISEGMRQKYSEQHAQVPHDPFTVTRFFLPPFSASIPAPPPPSNPHCTYHFPSDIHFGLGSFHCP